MRCVPQDKYTPEYYHACCDGYTEDGRPGRRLMTLLGHIPDIDKPRKALDLGCGRGEVAKYLREKGWEVVSMDYAIAAMECWHKNNHALGPFIRHDCSQGMPWMTSGYFDVVVMADVFEHLYPEQQKVVGVEVVRLAAPGALVLVDTPIMRGGESVLHVDIKESYAEVMVCFPGVELVGTHWHKKPEHCNIIMRKPTVKGNAWE